MTDLSTATEACVQPRRRRSFRRLLGRFLRVLGVLPRSRVSSPETQPGVDQSGTGRGNGRSEGFGDSAWSANEVSWEAGDTRLPQPPPGGKARPPGTQGLKNHGNTCFMNAVVQCLSNTDLLAEFLALGHYQARPGRAEVTEQLAGLVRSLWTLDYSPHLSVEFKVGRTVLGLGGCAPPGVVLAGIISLFVCALVHALVRPCVSPFTCTWAQVLCSESVSKYKGQSLPQTSTLSTESLPSGSGSKVLILLCNLVGSGHKAKRFGPPLLMREDRAISWDQLQQQVFNKVKCLMKQEVSVPSLGSLFAVRVVGLSVCSYLSSQDGRPLFHWAVERSLKLSRPGGPPHIKLAVEWDKTTKELFFGNIQEEVVQDAPSVQLQQQAHQQPSCTLNECFQLYTKEEQLAPDDAWKCPHCKILQQGMVKLSLWTLPDILIIHLKRFCQVGERRNKLSTLVKFPLFGLNMAPHVAKRSLGQEHLMNSWPSWEQASCLSNSCSFDFLYDLYAVCNHHGSMQGGHYTAYCRNSLDGQWYSYDDITVEPVLEEEVSTRGAYILFYQKRNIIPDWSASSSMRGSMSSSMSDHWLMRLRSNNSSQRKSLVSWSSANFDSISKIPDSPVFPKASTKEEKGESESKLFVRNNRGRSCSMKEPATSKRNQHGAFKTMPLRWSLGVKGRRKHESAELVEYLESGRRPKCTNRSIIPVMVTDAAKGTDVSASMQSNLRASTNDEWDSKGTDRKVQGTMMSPSSNLKKQCLPTSNTDTLKRTKKLKESPSQEMRLPQKLDVPLTVAKSAGTEEPTWAKSNGNKPNCNGNNHMSNVRNFSGVNRDDNERHSAKFWTKTQERNLESEHLQQGKFTFLRSVVLKKEPKKKDNNSEIFINSSFTSPSSSKWSNTDKEQGNKMLPCRHKESLSKDEMSLLEKGVSQVHSSFRLHKQVSWFQRASISHPLHRHVPKGQTSNGTFQRVKYHTIALGQKKIVPESSL
ncbi:ubiquitin carboxyl-terminal hydrolase 43 [Gracilinanus agilis]|uniref:ubiquitin carboxyl-terminal hydrolase 43 n=1 Tax=Gracilinanus agilis TaxID=191870 RepID=UPI001CFDAC80|nr:ubiquitin carboxyl-terminal hydrolase 43 [Gracilinanus agilis]